MSYIRELISETRTKRWCTNIPCTTCGCREFRKGLTSIGTDQIIADLGRLDFTEFYDHLDVIRSIFKWLHHEWALFSPSDLESIKGSVAWDYYESEYKKRRVTQKKSAENQILEEARQAEFRKKKALKASHDLINAIYRGDIKAVKGLVAKGGDPDLDRGPGTITARETARRLGKEDLYFPSPEEGTSE